MKAAVLHGPKNFQIVEMADPKCDPNGIIIRVKAVGICGSELGTFRGGLPEAAVESRGLEATSMSMLGHEWSGEVVEVGADQTHFKVGDKVLQGGYGGFVEYYAARGSMKIPEDWSFEVGATVEPMGIGMGLAQKMDPQPGETVAVFGAGMIGQGAWQVFKALGASKTIVLDISNKRLAGAKELGADVIINPAEEDAVARVNEITSGLGVDNVCLCCTAPAAYNQAFDVIRGGGLYQMQMRGVTEIDGKPVMPLSQGGRVGMVAVPGRIEWDSGVVYHKALRIYGSWGGAGGPAFELMKEGKIKTEPLITHEYPIEQINEAFEMACDVQESIKVLVKI